MFPLIGAIGTFLAGTAGATTLDALIRLLLSKGNRAAVGALARRLVGSAPKSFIGPAGRGAARFAQNPQAAGRVLRESLGQSAKTGAVFGGLDTAVRTLADIGTPASNNAYLVPNLPVGGEVSAGGAGSLDDILRMLIQSQAASGPLGGAPAMFR